MVAVSLKKKKKQKNFSLLPPTTHRSPILFFVFFFFQAEDGIRDSSTSRGLGDVYKRQIMIGFLFLGEQILSLIGIDVNSFAVAGALIIFFLALEMILGIQLYKDESSGTASIVPIAFPIIAGAGTLTSILSLRAEYDLANLIIAIVINIFIVYIVLKSSKRIERVLGPSGIGVIRKIFGVVLMAIAVKLFAGNVQQLFI